jgi:rod shape-determining protein MreD
MSSVNFGKKVGISLILALLLSVIYLPPSLHEWMPPWVAMVVFYWLIFKTVPLGVWVIWWIALLNGCLLGDPLGITSFLMVLLAWPLLNYQRTLKFIAASSRWLIWLLVSGGFALLNVLLMGAFGYVGLNPVSFKPVISVFILSPVIYFLLSLYAESSLPPARNSR